MSENFDEFTARELPSLLRYATVLTGDPELARDLVQDVMLKAHARWDQVSGAEWPRAHVRTMITNAHLSWRRRWSVRNLVVRDSVTLLDVAAPDDMAAVDERAHVRQLLAGLPRQQRAALVLRFYEGLSDEEISRVLGCTTGTVRGYISRALATLRNGSTRSTSQPQEIRK